MSLPRPPSPRPKEKRRIDLRMSEQLYKLIADYAEDHSVTFSHAIRSLALSRLRQIQKASK
jgi:hypothetical protein